MNAILILSRYWAGCDKDGLPLPKLLDPRFEAYFKSYSITLSGETGTTELLSFVVELHFTCKDL